MLVWNLNLQTYEQTKKKFEVEEEETYLSRDFEKSNFIVSMVRLNNTIQ